MQGGVSLDGKTVADTEAEITPHNGMVLKVGKRRYLKIISDKGE